MGERERERVAEASLRWMGVWGVRGVVGFSMRRRLELSIADSSIL